MSIRQFLCASGIALSALPVWPQVTAPAPSPASLSLAQALQAARDNLEVALARLSLAGARADILSADRSPFPNLSAGISGLDLQNGNGDGNVLTERRLDKSIGLDWTWERGNKRALRTLSAQRAADAAQAELDETLTQQLLAAHAGFFDLLAAQERREEVGQIARSAAELATSAQQRVQAGDLSAQDLARTEIEARRAQSELRQAELERQRSALLLWQVTGLSTSAQQLSAQADWPAIGADPTEGADLQTLVQARPDVRAAQARVQAARATLDGAGALKSPDVTLGASYDHYPGTSTALLALRLSVPLQLSYGYQGEIARAGAQLAQAEQALEKTRRLARLELERLQHEARSTAERARTYFNDILPRARQVAAGAELAYSKGAIPLTDLLDARRTLRATLLDALSARSEHAKAVGAWHLRNQPPPAPGATTQ